MLKTLPALVSSNGDQQGNHRTVLVQCRTGEELAVICSTLTTNFQQQQAVSFVLMPSTCQAVV